MRSENDALFLHGIQCEKQKTKKIKAKKRLIQMLWGKESNINEFTKTK